jgi:thymidine kinase
MESKSGYLGIILGSMFSGKTTRIIQLYKTYSYIGKKIAVINHLSDNRYTDTMLSTHDQIMIPCYNLSDLKDSWKNPFSEFYSILRKAEVILINEAQFFHGLKEVVLEMVEKYDKYVVICGLDGDFKRKPFGEILDLIPYCDSVEKLTSLCAKCKDGTPGIFSKRISDEQGQIVVGSDNYQPLCRNCYLLE